MDLSRTDFEQQRQRRFGLANPERMHVPFWNWMLRGEGFSRPDPDDADAIRVGLSPWHARRVFPSTSGAIEAPIWTFERMGRTQTRLPDGRIICIGGEHEDYYDPDFQIYNDVVVFYPNGAIEVYGYPREEFPPTDFHTATLIADRILIIGSLGYQEERRPGQTPVFKLDVRNYVMEPVATTGDGPGWINHHSAEHVDGFIQIRGGQRIETRGDQSVLVPNFEDYSFDTARSHWSRLTNRKWRCLSIRRARGLFHREHEPPCSHLYPTSIPYVVMHCADWKQVRFRVADVPVQIDKDIFEIRLVIEGDLTKALGDQIAAEICANVQAVIGKPCRVV